MPPPIPPPPPRTLLVLDPGYDFNVGHHHTLNTYISEQARASGWTPIILGHTQLPNAQRDLRFFRASLYAPHDTPSSLVAWAGTTCQIFREDLAKIDLSRVASSTRVLVHTCSFTFLFALTEWLIALRDRGVTPSVHLHFYFPDAFWTHDPQARQLGTMLSEQSLKALTAANLGVTLSSDTPSLAARLKGWSGQDVAVIRHPLEAPSDLPSLDAPSTTANDGQATFLFMGNLRPEKGSSVILGLLATLRDEAPNAHFRFVVPALSKEARRTFERHGGQVSVRVEPTLTAADYYREIQAATFTMCLYSPVTYHMRGSGILMDSLAVGTPVLCSESIGSLEHLNDQDRAAVIITPFTEQGILNGFLSAMKNADAHHGAAQALAPKLRSVLTPQAWFKSVLG